MCDQLMIPDKKSTQVSHDLPSLRSNLKDVFAITLWFDFFQILRSLSYIYSTLITSFLMWVQLEKHYMLLVKNQRHCKKLQRWWKKEERVLTTSHSETRLDIKINPREVTEMLLFCFCSWLEEKSKQSNEILLTKNRWHDFWTELDKHGSRHDASPSIRQNHDSWDC